MTAPSERRSRDGNTRRDVARGGWGRSLLEFFLPGACTGCGGRMPLERWRERICGRCRSRLRSPPPPLCERCGLPVGTGAGGGPSCEECRRWPDAIDRARSAVVLQPPADRLVHALKYGGWRGLAEPMGRRIARIPLAQRAGGSPRAVVVPVPTTRTRRRRRGYNQAAALAETVARALDRPMLEALRRRSGGRTQVALHPLERGRNVSRAFAVRGAFEPHLRRRPVLLVDDVLTTGATAGAAARCLEAAGAGNVTLLTFARALPYRDSS